MAEAKKKTFQSPEEAHASKKQQPETKQVVVTLGVPGGEVLKLEKLDKAGHRHQLSEEEFAALAGEDDAEDLGAVLEGAYTAGISDAITDELSEEEEAADEDEEEIVRRFMLRRAAGRQLLRSGIRNFILRRRLRRDLAHRQQAKPEHNGRSNGAKD